MALTLYWDFKRLKFCRNSVKMFSPFTAAGGFVQGPDDVYIHLDSSMGDWSPSMGTLITQLPIQLHFAKPTKLALISYGITTSATYTRAYLEVNIVKPQICATDFRNVLACLWLNDDDFDSTGTYKPYEISNPSYVPIQSPGYVREIKCVLTEPASIPIACNLHATSKLHLLLHFKSDS